MLNVKNVVRWNLYGNITFNRHATIVCDLNIRQCLFSQRLGETNNLESSQADLVSSFGEEDESSLSATLFNHLLSV